MPALLRLTLYVKLVFLLAQDTSLRALVRGMSNSLANSVEDTNGFFRKSLRVLLWSSVSGLGFKPGTNHGLPYLSLRLLSSSSDLKGKAKMWTPSKVSNLSTASWLIRVAL